MDRQVIVLHCRNCFHDMEARLFTCAEVVNGDSYHVKVILEARCPSCGDLLATDYEVLQL